MSSTKYVLFRPIRKPRRTPQPLKSQHIFNFFSETTELNVTKLDRKQELNYVYQDCVFRADWKTNMAAKPLICWYIFYFLWATEQIFYESLQEIITLYAPFFHFQ